MTASTTITIREMIDRTTDFFVERGIESARLDAQLLIGYALGKSRLELYLHFDYPVNEAELERARELVRRRAAREPVAYIVGVKEFAGRDFVVAPGVLIPRPDTEILVDEVTAELAARQGEASEGSRRIRILEFGIGSGAISVTLAANDPRVHVTATEISPAAVKIAGENADRHGVGDRVEIREQADFSGIEGPFDVLVSNPPYIDLAEKPTLAPEVAEFEPPEALFAEESGLRWYKFLAEQARVMLDKSGFLAVEIGYRQRLAVEDLFEGAGLRVLRSKKDYGGNYRVVLAEVAD